MYFCYYKNNIYCNKFSVTNKVLADECSLKCILVCDWMVGVKGRRRVPSAVLGPPHSSAGAGPGRSQWAEPACGGEGVARPGEGLAAASGGQAAEPRKSRSGAAPAGGSTKVKTASLKMC